MRRKRLGLIILVLILFISIGFAVLTINLNIQGGITFRDNVWDVHFANIEVESGSTDEDTPIISSNDTTIDFSVSFTRPGDYYEFYVDVVNAGTMDASIDEITKTTLTGDYATYLTYTTTYYNGDSIVAGDVLRAGTNKRIKIRVEYKYDVASYVKLNDINLTYSLKYLS